MAIRIITGNPRTGKSLLAVQIIFDQAKLGTRPIYTNITDIKIDGVKPMPSFDWNECPDYSLIVIDEPQDIVHPERVNNDGTPFLPYAATGKSGFENDPWLKNLSTHGKRCIDIIFITQHPTFIHHQMRKMPEWHKHVIRTMGFARATVFTWFGSSVTQPQEPAERRSAEKQTFKYPKHLYKLYTSAVGHTVKWFLPKKAVMAVTVGLLTIILGTYWLSTKAGVGDTSVSGKSPTEQAASSVFGADPLASTRPFNNQSLEIINSAQTITKSISGCVAGRFCRCFDEDGNILDLTEFMCRKFADGNLALPIKITQNSGNSQNKALK